MAEQAPGLGRSELREGYAEIGDVRQLPVPRDAPGKLADHRRHWAVRPCERHRYRHDQPQGLLPCNSDGSYAVGHPSLHEVDTVTFSGTLSF
jgi:hypothetical protein